MTTYTATFSSDAEYASHDFEAETPAQALALAREFYVDETTELWFDHYAETPVNEIAIKDADENEFAVWQSEDLLLRLAARYLLDAVQHAVVALNTIPRFNVRQLDSDSYNSATAPF
jgi:hypothetical protein